MSKQRGFAILSAVVVLAAAALFLFGLMRADIARQQRYLAPPPPPSERIRAVAEQYYDEHPDWTRLDLNALRQQIAAQTGYTVSVELLLSEENPVDGVRYRSLALYSSQAAADEFSAAAIIIDGEAVQRRALAKLRAQLKALARLLESYHIQRSAAAAVIGSGDHPFAGEEARAAYWDAAEAQCVAEAYFAADSAARCAADIRAAFNFYDIRKDCAARQPALPCGEGLRLVSAAADFISADLWRSPYGGAIYYHVRAVADARAGGYAETNQLLAVSHTTLTDIGAVLLADLPSGQVEWFAATKARARL